MGFSFKSVVGGAAQTLSGGLYNPKDGSISVNNSVKSLGGLGGYATMAGMDGANLMGGKGKYYGKDNKSKDATDRAIADQQAAVLREQIKSQEKISAETIAANLKASKNSAIAGIIGAALGANTTTETIKQMLPHESGAAMMMSYDLAEKWNTTRTMKEQGYSGVAIEYALNGKSGKALYKDAEMNSLMQARDVRQMTTQSIQTFGIKSASNPYGVDITPEQFERMHSIKDQGALLEVDPVVAAARNKAMGEWEAKMRAEGKGILVDVYKNPQLGGSNIMAMKGKNSLIPPEMLPLIQSVAGSNQGSGTDWDAAIKAMSTGEVNGMTKQMKWAMSVGLIDKYGQVNAGTVLSMLPPELQGSPEFDPYRKMGIEEKAKIQDDYVKFSQTANDPKLMRSEALGMGVTRQYKFNADGSVAGTMMSGYMQNAMGEQIQVTMPGDRLQEWYNQQSKIGGMGPLFPPMMAPVTNSELNGTFEADFWGKNALAKPNQGVKGTGKEGGAGTSLFNPTMPSALPKPPTNTNAAPPIQGASTPMQAGAMPTGFSGAPLAAGD